MKDDNRNDVLESSESVQDNDSTVESQKPKSLIETIKEIDEQERLAEIEREKKLQEYHEREREEYSKKVQQDKIELIKLKQGVIERSDTIHEVHEEKKTLTFPEKVSNFFYHNVWWIWVALFIAVIAGILIYQAVTTVKPDAVVLMFAYDDNLYDDSNEKMAEYFGQFVDDVNGDGVPTVYIYYIPLSIDESNSLFTSYMAKFSSEMQSASSMIVLADSSCDERLFPSDVLYDLTKSFGSYENVQDYGYYLKDTNFAEEIGYGGTISDDLYVGIRKVQSILDSKEKMQENFDTAFNFLSRLINYQENGEGVEDIG